MSGRGNTTAIQRWAKSRYIPLALSQAQIVSRSVFFLPAKSSVADALGAGPKQSWQAALGGTHQS